MEQELRNIIDGMKAQLRMDIIGMRKMQENSPVSGERYTLPLEGRKIHMAYYPTPEKGKPLLIAFHGGGFLFGNYAVDNAMWIHLRDTLDVNVASIDYRKTPEYKWPSPVIDAYDATIYLKEHAEKFGFNTDHVSVIGCSAGANIAAAVCLYAKQKGENLYRYQILNYPYIDLDTDPDLKGEGSMSGPIMHVFREFYVEPEETKEITASPIFVTKEGAKGLPTAIIQTAGNDNLRFEGESYANILRGAGVDVYFANAAGMPHGYFEYGLGDEISTAYLEADLKEMLSEGSMSKAAIKALEFIKKNYKIY